MLVNLSKPADKDIMYYSHLSVRDPLVYIILVGFESPYSLPEPRRVLGNTPFPKRKGQTYPVYCDLCWNPNCFCIQELGNEADYFETMIAHTQDAYTKQMKDTWQIICPAVGMFFTVETASGILQRSKTRAPGHCCTVCRLWEQRDGQHPQPEGNH